MAKHLVIPDCQVKAGVPIEHLYWCGQYIVDKKPDTVIMLGDFADMPSLSSYDKRGSKNFENRRYKDDLAAVQRGMKALMTPLREYNANAQKTKHAKYNPRLVMLYGNHEDRITRAINDDPAHLDGIISLDDLLYTEWGWECIPFLVPIIIDGVLYIHYMPTGKLGKPCESAKMLITKHHMSIVVGHTQGRDFSSGKRGDGKPLTAIIAGSFYQHDEEYMPHPTNQHWRGIYVLHEVNDGQFDEMAVSLDYLRRKYGN